MGSMSASDAAPLPRLGEVFFDVRGSSRSMRLSWYADTGVAVFSIWQGGMCTGTFRLAIGDLPRMVETLQRGPGGQPPGPHPALPGPAFGDAPLDATAQVRGLEPLAGEERAEYQSGLPGYGPDHWAGPADYPAGPADYPAGPADYPAGPADHRAEAPDRRTEYLADPPGPGHEASRERNGQTAGAGPAGYGDALYPGRRSEDWNSAPRPEAYPGRPDASYPGARPEAYPGGPEASYPGARPEESYPGGPEASYPDRRSEAWNPGRPETSYPGASTGGPHPRGTTSQGGHPGGVADDPYLAGTGPMDFPHYPAGTSAPGHAAGHDRSAADYPAHYGAAVGDDIAPTPPPESFPYGQPPVNRGSAGRHADPDASFD